MKLHETVGITRSQFRECLIYKFSPLSGTPFYEFQMIGRKYCSEKLPHHGGGRGLFHPSQNKTLFILNGDFRLLFPDIIKIFHSENRAFFAKTDEIFFPGIAKGTHTRKEPDGLKKIGLSLSILPEDHIDTLGGLKFHGLYISEVPDLEGLNFHSLTTSNSDPEMENVSPGLSFFPRWIQGSPLTSTLPS